MKKSRISRNPMEFEEALEMKIKELNEKMGVSGFEINKTTFIRKYVVPTIKAIDISNGISPRKKDKRKIISKYGGGF